MMRIPCRHAWFVTGFIEFNGKRHECRRCHLCGTVERRRVK